jgi:hypothetical protein
VRTAGKPYSKSRACVLISRRATLLLEESLVEQAKPNCTDQQTRRLPER